MTSPPLTEHGLGRAAEALAERDGYALFAMGRRSEKGCFCPVNALLRDAIDQIIDLYAK